MIDGHFYFIKDSFYKNLADCNLMSNKENNAGTGKRPCHYCFECDNYFWMIPISSQVEKYKKIYDQKIMKRGYCDSIRFGYVNGKERVFLLQNCFPITQEFVDNEYRVEKNTIAVVASEDLSRELNAMVRKIIRQYKNGRIIPLTKIDKIISFLEHNHEAKDKIMLS